MKKRLKKSIFSTKFGQMLLPVNRNLAQNILTLRKTLSRFKKDKEFIVMIPRPGYRFVENVQEISGNEEIIVVEKQTRTQYLSQKRFYDTDFSLI